LKDVNFTAVRGFDGIKEAEVDLAGTKLRCAVAYGLANVHKLLTEIKEGKRQYHFVEIMTCPGGCLGGGGQPHPKGLVDPMDRSWYEKRAKGLYGIDEEKKYRKSHENPQIKQIYAEFLKEPLGHQSHKLLHTSYAARAPKGIPAPVKETVSI